MKCLLTYGVITHFTYKEEMSNIQSDYLFFLFFKLGDISTDMVPTEASPDQSKYRAYFSNSWVTFILTLRIRKNCPTYAVITHFTYKEELSNIWSDYRDLILRIVLQHQVPCKLGDELSFEQIASATVFFILPRENN